MPDLSDTSTWLPLNGLEPGFDANKPATTDALSGRTITIDDTDTSVSQYSFTDSQVAWNCEATSDDAAHVSEGVDECEVFQVDDELYYVQFHTASHPDTAVSLVLDMRSGHALSVATTIGEAGAPRVGQVFTPGVIRGMRPSGRPPAPSTALIGRRVMWTYSRTHTYEHTYLTRHWYTWQCLSGPEQGLADTDENSTWELRPGIYVFAWREKVIPCASVTVADHRNIRAMRSIGVLFGLSDNGDRTYFTMGAHGRLMSTITYPESVDPARQREQ